MQCTTPAFIQDKSTGGILYVPCGRCLACRLARARMWSIRIMHETKEWPESSFLTLTYNDENLPKNGTLVKEHVQKFFKRLRKNLNCPFKYYLGGEYGDRNLRPHYHVVLFGVGKSRQKEIDHTWGLGFVHAGDVTHDSARYVASYTLKKLTGERRVEYESRGVIPEFSLMSRNPGIGARYADKNQNFLKTHACVIVQGNKAALPRYYADRLFNEEEKVLLRAAKREYYDQQFEEIKKKSGATEGFQVQEYQATQRYALSCDLEARQKLKRRKL